MDSNIWNQALDILELDTSIKKIYFDSMISKMKEVSFDDNGLLTLSCRDEYSKEMILQSNLTTNITNAVSLVADRKVTLNLIVEGDEKAYIASTIAANKAIIKEQKSFNNGISSEFTLENFIVGDTNRFAHAASVQVANNPGQRQRNPLFFWSNPGLGKTHLMKAIGYRITQNFPEKTVLYTTCEEFTNTYVMYMKNKNFEEFRNKYRSLDVLLIDDIQFLIGKEGSQGEFFNTFESLINSGKQIVITSDKAPSNLKELDERLTSRFKNGIYMDIQPPDYETRKAILLSYIKRDNISLSDDIINYICENITQNVRDLSGAYNNVTSYFALNNGNITLDDVINILASSISPGANKTITPDIIIEAVAKYYDLTKESIVSKMRDKEIKNARAVASYLCHSYLEMTYKKIGEIFGGRKHSTVMNSINTVDSDPELLKDVENIKKRLLDY